MNLEQHLAMMMLHRRRFFLSFTPWGGVVHFTCWAVSVLGLETSGFEGSQQGVLMAILLNPFWLTFHNLSHGMLELRKTSCSWLYGFDLKYWENSTGLLEYPSAIVAWRIIPVSK